MKEALAFEEAMKRLEKIIEQLEKGEIPLESSLSLFEEGVKLSRFCREKLDEAEKKVEILLKNEGGIFYREPFLLEPKENNSESENC